MDGNKSIDVSLELDTVQFTINTNVSSTITINGDTSTNVTSKTVVVPRGSTVSWSASAAGYDTQSGERTASETESINVSLSIQYYTYTVVTNVASAITINGSTTSGVTSKSIQVPYGSTVSWSVKSETNGYDDLRGNISSGTDGPFTGSYTRSVTLPAWLIVSASPGYCTLDGRIQDSWVSGSFIRDASFDIGVRSGGYTEGNNGKTYWNDFDGTVYMDCKIDSYASGHLSYTYNVSNYQSYYYNWMKKVSPGGTLSLSINVELSDL